MRTGKEIFWFLRIFTTVYSNSTVNFLSDSRIKSVFKDILKGVGRESKTGKKKDGIKVHTVVNADEVFPSLVWFNKAKKHDHLFLDKLKCNENTVYVFDKRYNDYKAFAHFTTHKMGFVIRIKDNASILKS